jgi:hypothetical protein
MNESLASKLNNVKTGVRNILYYIIPNEYSNSSLVLSASSRIFLVILTSVFATKD